MSVHSEGQIMLEIILGLGFGLLALYTSTKIKKVDSISLLKNRRLSFQIVGYMLISGSILMGLGLLLSK